MDKDKTTWNILPSEGRDPAIGKGKKSGQNRAKWSSYSEEGESYVYGWAHHTCKLLWCPKSTAAAVQGLNCAQTSRYRTRLQNNGL